MIEGALVSDLRYLATQLTPIKDLKTIILISNNNELNDENVIKDNAEITVELRKQLLIKPKKAYHILFKILEEQEDYEYSSDDAIEEDDESHYIENNAYQEIEW